jgi:hypothetical protein
MNGDLGVTDGIYGRREGNFRANQFNVLPSLSIQLTLCSQATGLRVAVRRFCLRQSCSKTFIDNPDPARLNMGNQ